jgi:hypothetical protein
VSIRIMAGENAAVMQELGQQCISNAAIGKV